MMNHNVGDKSKFAFAKDKIITDVQKVDFKYVEEHNFGVCPECGHQLAKRQTFRIVELVSINNGEHYVGYSDQGHTLRILKEYIDELREKQGKKPKAKAKSDKKIKKKKNNITGGDSN